MAVTVLARSTTGDRSTRTNSFLRYSAWDAVLVALSLAASACDRNDREQAPQRQRAATPTRQNAPTDQAGVTPMAERVAVIGLLNKRNGIVRDLVLKPGQSARVKGAVVRLRACETAAPWENQPLTGAFIQLDVQLPDGRWSRAFSGWLYKESPSLNVVEHPVYDVNLLECKGVAPVPPTPAPAATSAAAKPSGKSRPKTPR